MRSGRLHILNLLPERPVFNYLSNKNFLNPDAKTNRRASPPPMQRLADTGFGVRGVPFADRVAMMRAQTRRFGCEDTAAPFTFTLAWSMPISCIGNQRTTAKASLISTDRHRRRTSRLFNRFAHKRWTGAVVKFRRLMRVAAWLTSSSQYLWPVRLGLTAAHSAPIGRPPS